jgi:hypothetical protein
MNASGPPNKRSTVAAAEAIWRSWPMASPETVGRLVRLGSVVERTGGTLMTEGERPSRVALVLSGTVVSTWSAPDGRVAYAGLFGPGQLIGLTTLTGASIASGVGAVTRVAILFWPSREFRAVTDTDLAVSLALLDRCVYVIRLVNPSRPATDVHDRGQSPGGAVAAVRGLRLREGCAAPGAGAAVGPGGRHAADGEQDSPQVGIGRHRQARRSVGARAT